MGQGLSPEMRRLLGLSRNRPQGTPDGVDLLLRDAIEMAYPSLKYRREPCGAVPDPGTEKWDCTPIELNRARAAVSRTFRRMEQRQLAIRHRGHRWSGIALTELGHRHACHQSTYWFVVNDEWLRKPSTAERLERIQERKEHEIRQFMESTGCDLETAKAAYADWEANNDLHYYDLLERYGLSELVPQR